MSREFASPLTTWIMTEPWIGGIAQSHASGTWPFSVIYATSTALASLSSGRHFHTLETKRNGDASWLQGPGVPSCYKRGAGGGGEPPKRPSWHGSSEGNTTAMKAAEFG